MLLAATKFPTGSKEVGYKMMSADVAPDGRLGLNNGTIATFTEEIAALEKGIKNLDKSVAEATEQRKAENAEHKEPMVSDTASKEVLGFAKNSLNEVLQPKAS